MALREDLTYEKRKTETPYIHIDASDIDEALRIASRANGEDARRQETLPAAKTALILVAAALFDAFLLALWWLLWAVMRG